TTLNASNLSSGTVPNARISGTYTGLTNLTGSGIVDFANFRGNAGDSVTVPSYSWTGNTNTGIYQPGTNQIGFTTNGVARMTINATGVVNVPGSLTLGTALAVAQGGTGALSFPAGRLLFGDGTSALNTSSGLFWDNTLSNLGIGVGSPNASLHARGLNVNEELNSIAVLDSGSSTAGVGLHIGGFRSSSTGLRHVALQVYQVGGTTVRALSLQPEGGNVGIGVTNPSARLQVDGTVTATTFSGSGASLTALNASNLSSGTVPNARISGSYTGMTNLTGSGVVDFSSFRGNASDSVTAPSFSWTGETNMGMYRPSSLSIGFSVAGINQLTITSSKVAATNGFTGDGSSLTDLDASNITSGTLLAGRLPNSWSGTKTLWNTTYFGNNTASNFYTTANINGFTTSSNNSGAVSMESGANSTNTRHHISFSNPNGVVGSIHTNNNATAYNTSSDYRLKTNATDVDNAIDRLMNLHPRRFSWVSDPTGEMIDGFFAHEVQAIIPNAVTGLYNDIDPITGNPLYQSIDHSKIIPLLTAALQDTIRQVSTTSAQVLSMTDSFTANIIHASNLEGGATTLSTDANGNIIRTPSDKRLKTNVTDINSALDTILSLRGVRYEWVDKDRFGNMTEIGFLAQEVDTVLPELVRKGGEYWTLNTPNMLAVVVEAMKEMWQSVTELSEKVAGLDKKVKTQELCIGATCVTEAQLLQLLQQQSQTSNPPPSSPTPPIVVEEGGGDEESAVVAPEEEVIEEVSVVEEGNDTGEPIA
ncbi:MAG: tail fiber domain-containing protein, partial [Candidatus Paceibacteria bacterium]